MWQQRHQYSNVLIIGLYINRDNNNIYLFNFGSPFQYLVFLPVNFDGRNINMVSSTFAMCLIDVQLQVVFSYLITQLLHGAEFRALFILLLFAKISC